MGTPTKKRTRGQRRRRASHFALAAKTLGVCPQCKKPVLPHHACGFCGFYRARKVFETVRHPKKSTTAKR